jgi:hypothetical protein
VTKFVGDQASNNHHQSCGNRKKFNRHIIGDGMFSVTKMIGNKMLLVTKLATTKSISLLIMWQFIYFSPHTFLDLGHLINDRLISTIDLATKFGLSNNKI